MICNNTKVIHNMTMMQRGPATRMWSLYDQRIASDQTYEWYQKMVNGLKHRNWQFARKKSIFSKCQSTFCPIGQLADPHMGVHICELCSMNTHIKMCSLVTAARQLCNTLQIPVSSISNTKTLPLIGIVLRISSYVEL